jgi:GNAT superfamily N-acetyltransferase
MTSRVRSALERVRAEARARGWRRALRSGASLAFRRLVYARLDEVVIACDLTQPLDLELRTDLVVEEIGPSHLSLLEEFGRAHTSRADTSKLLAYLRNGYRGQIALQKGEMIGYVWSAHGRGASGYAHPTLARLGLALGPREVCSFDLFVAPPYRGRDRATAFYGKHLLTLRAMGFERAFGWVAPDNVRARVLYRTLGWKDIGRHASRLLFATFMISPRGIFVRNGRRSRTPFDFRPLLPFASLASLGRRGPASSP